MAAKTGSLVTVLELRGKAQMVAGLRDVNSGVRQMTSALKASGVEAGVADRNLTGVYRREHLTGVSTLTTRFRSLRSEIVGIGLALGGGAGVVSLLKTSVSLANQLQTTNTQIAVASGAKAGNLPGIVAMQGQLAGYGFNKQQAALSQYHIESAYGGAISNAATRAMLQNAGRLYAIGGGAQGGMDQVQTASLLATLLRADQSLKNNSGRGAALLNATHAAGNMTMADLVATLGTGAPASLAAMGVSFASLAPALAVAGDTRGGEQVAPFARTLQTSIMKAFNPTPQGRAAAKGLGLGQYELQNDLRGPNGVVTMIDDLSKHLAPLSKNAQNQAVGQMFGGTKGSAPIFTLLGNMGMLNSKTGQIASAADMNTFLSDSNKSLSTFSMQWLTVKNTMSNVETSLGQKIVPLTGKLAGFGASLFGGGPGMGGKLHNAGKALFAGNFSQVGGALGLSPADSKKVTSTLNDMVEIGKDADRIFRQDLVPTIEELAKLGGGAFYVGTAVLKDTLGVIAAHPTAIKGVIDSMLALYAVKKVGAGITALANLPATLGTNMAAKQAAASTTLSKLTSPIDSFNAAYYGRSGKGGTSPVAFVMGDDLPTRMGKTGSAAATLGSRLRSSGVGGAIGGITAAIGGYAAGSTGSKGSAVEGGLMAALTGAAIGFSVGGPLGAAIGGFGGIAGTAVGYLTHISSAAETAAKNAGTLGKNLGAALLADQGKPGQSSMNALNTYESSTPAAVRAFANAGLTNADISSALNGQIDAKMRAVLDATSGPGLQAASYLNQISSQFKTAALNDLDMAKLQGQALGPWQATIANSQAIANGTAYAARQIGLANGTLSLYALPPGTAAGAKAAIGVGNLPPSVKQGIANLAGLSAGLNGLGNGVARAPGQQRAAGGPVRAGLSYRIGENGAETLVMGQDGHILSAHDTRKIAAGGSGLSVGQMHLHFHGVDVTTEAGAKQVASSVVKQLRYQSARN